MQVPSPSLILVRGVEHYYEWIGDRTRNLPVMIFLHGWGGSARYWRNTAIALSDEFNCLLYDLRGFGRSRLPQTPLELSYELEEYAEDLAALMAEFNIDRAILNAHSMGASVAVLFLNSYPEKSDRAILNCTGIFEYDEKAFAAFYQFGGYVVKFRYNWFMKVPFTEQMFMARFLHRPIPKQDKRAFLEDYLLADRAAALQTIFTCVNQRAVEMMPEKFSRLSMPTLLIAGEKDKIIPPEMGRKAAALNEKIEYCEIPKTGHFPMLEDAATYLRSVREFLGVGRALV